MALLAVKEPRLNSTKEPPERVVYLLGAGATHGCATFLGSDLSLVMPGLIESLSERMHEAYLEDFQDDEGIGRLVNEVVTRETDFEHLITFLEDAVSARYGAFAARLKEIFSSVLRARLAQVREIDNHRHSELYAVLLDLHTVDAVPEQLQGFLTLNYDVFLEHAIEARLGLAVDYGVSIASDGIEDESRDAIPVLKLHGSFGWTDGWPISVAPEDAQGLWIPPGIRKAKADYPFNAIWGRARELLDCDVLRIVGCNLGPNDWDLVSMLFTTMHTHASKGPYRIEVISWPSTAERISKSFPYLSVLSLLELPEAGPQIVSEVIGGEPRSFAELDEDDRRRAVQGSEDRISNPFEYWLRIRGELLSLDHSLETETGLALSFVDAG